MPILTTAIETTAAVVSTTQGNSVVVPANTHIKRDEISDEETRVKMLTDAGCRGHQACNDHNSETEKCGNGSYGMTTCSGKFRYFIHGCCGPTSTGSRSTFFNNCKICSIWICLYFRQ